MNNLQKFNNTIEEFDKELIKLKDTSEAYQKLQGLVNSYAKINEQFIKNSKSLEDIAVQQQQKQVELAKSLTSLQDTNKAGKDEIKKHFSNLSSTNTVLSFEISLLVSLISMFNAAKKASVSSSDVST